MKKVLSIVLAVVVICGVCFAIVSVVKSKYEAIDYSVDITNYTLEEIEADDSLYAIGATEPEYVVAKFNGDRTEVLITKNGEYSDGEMDSWMIFNATTEGVASYNNSPMSNAYDTLMSAVIKDGVTSIGGGTFWFCRNLTNVTIPNSVNYIDSEAFLSSSYLTIHGETGSYAETWANENDVPFVVV